VLSVSACGYKAPPYYEDDAPAADANVKFIMEKKKFGQDTNESCDSK